MLTDKLYILSYGKVAAINKKDGSIIWEKKLKEYISSMSVYGVGQLQLEADKLYIGISGQLLCLRAKDGSLIWKNELKGWGYNFISFANQSAEAVVAMQQQQAAS